MKIEEMCLAERKEIQLKARKMIIIGKELFSEEVALIFFVINYSVLSSKRNYHYG